MILATLSDNGLHTDDMIPYRLQEHVAQVLSFLKMQLTFLNEETEQPEIHAQMPAITELISRCIHTLRDLHVPEAPQTFDIYWMEQLRQGIQSLHRPPDSQLVISLTGTPMPLNHYRAITLYRVLLTAAHHILLLCLSGKPTLELQFSDAGLSALFSDAGRVMEAPRWMQQSMEFLKHQAAIINAELNWNFSGSEQGNQIILKLAR